MQQKEDSLFTGHSLYRKKGLTWYNGLIMQQKKELHFLEDIDYIERRFDLLKLVKHEAKRELPF